MDFRKLIMKEIPNIHPIDFMRYLIQEKKYKICRIRSNCICFTSKDNRFLIHYFWDGSGLSFRDCEKFGDGLWEIYEFDEIDWYQNIMLQIDPKKFKNKG